MMALKSTAMFSKDTYRNHADDKGEGVLTEGGQGETLVLLLQLNAGSEREVGLGAQRSRQQVRHYMRRNQSSLRMQLFLR